MKNKKNIALYAHQERVVIELKELSRKRDDLLAFFDTPTFKEMENQDQNLLTIQLETMDSYIRILEARIDRFYELNYKEYSPANKFLFSCNGTDYSRSDLEKAYESWNKESLENPEDFEENLESVTGSDFVDSLIMYLESTKNPQFPKDKIEKY